MGQVPPLPEPKQEKQFNAAFDVMVDAVKIDFPGSTHLSIAVTVEHGTYAIRRSLEDDSEQAYYMPAVTQDSPGNGPG
jgi:hypothetical protein